VTTGLRRAALSENPDRRHDVGGDLRNASGCASTDRRTPGWGGGAPGCLAARSPVRRARLVGDQRHLPITLAAATSATEAVASVVSVNGHSKRRPRRDRGSRGLARRMRTVPPGTCSASKRSHTKCGPPAGSDPNTWLLRPAARARPGGILVSVWSVWPRADPACIGGLLAGRAEGRRPARPAGRTSFRELGAAGSGTCEAEDGGRDRLGRHDGCAARRPVEERELPEVGTGPTRATSAPAAGPTPNPRDQKQGVPSCPPRSAACRQSERRPSPCVEPTVARSRREQCERGARHPAGRRVSRRDALGHPRLPQARSPAAT